MESAILVRGSLIKEGRKELKRSGVLFTCLSSRVIHIEVPATLETDSFINYWEFNVRYDQVNNLVGAKNELQKMLSSMDQTYNFLWNATAIGLNSS